MTSASTPHGLSCVISCHTTPQVAVSCLLWHDIWCSITWRLFKQCFCHIWHHRMSATTPRHYVPVYPDMISVTVPSVWHAVMLHHMYIVIYDVSCSMTYQTSGHTTYMYMANPKDIITKLTMCSCWSWCGLLRYGRFVPISYQCD